MPRRRRKPNLLLTVPLWVAIACLVGWGLLQLAEFRKQVLAAPVEAEVQPAQVLVATAPASDPSTQVAISTEPTTDPWTEATTPATAPTTDTLDTTLPTLAQTKPAPPTIAVDIPDPVPPTRQEAFQQVVDLTNSATAFLDQGRVVEARTALNSALIATTDGPLADQLRDQLTTLNTPVFLGTALYPDDPAATYVDIRPGDSFQKIAHRYAIPSALVAAINPSLSSTNLKPATGIKIIQGPFNIRLAKHAGRLDLYARDLYIRSFPATLEAGNFLPSGIYRIKPDSKIQLNKRQWIGFEGTDDATRDISSGWLYGSSGPRAAQSPNEQITGLKLDDPDLSTLFITLVDSRSLLRVDP